MFLWEIAMELLLAALYLYIVCMLALSMAVKALTDCVMSALKRTWLQRREEKPIQIQAESTLQQAKGRGIMQH